MKTKLCLPIIKETTKEIVETIEAHKETYDMFEVWIDYIDEPVIVILNLIQNLSNNLKERLIVVFRRKNGETIHMPFEKRMMIIKTLANTKTFVDLDLERQQQDLNDVKNQKIGVRVITSFHDYKKTPRTSSLVKIIQDMELFGPEIYKIATYCESPKQAIMLMHFLLDMKEQKKHVIILGMGIHGKITRIFGALYGNEITFAPETKDTQSAPDQLTREELLKVLEVFYK